MKITAVVSNSKEKRTDVNVVLCWQKSSSGKSTKVEVSVEKDIKSQIETAVDEGCFDGKKEEILFLRGIGDSSAHTLVVGAGTTADATTETLRRCGAAAYKKLSVQKSKTARLSVKSLGAKFTKKLDSSISAFLEGFLLASYNYDEHKSEKNKPTLDNFEISVDKATQKKTADNGIKRAQGLYAGVEFARKLGDAPGNDVYPVSLAKKVQTVFRNSKVKVTVWDEARLKKEKMNLHLSVGQGSDQPSRLIIMEYKGAAASKKPVCFVGKGITFDSGGISIKPSQAMEEMKYDMCGAASVIGTMVALEQTKAKVNAIAIVAAAENMPSGAATKPGDVFTGRNGKTVEVFNTDAEGRLALADALTLASEKKPAVIIDAATLTGAMVIALGAYYTGYFTQDDKLAKKIEAAAKDADETAWRMPFDENHVKEMKGIIADLKNIGNSRGAGSGTAAAFLSQFVDEKIPWAHFDIAGTAWNVSGVYPYCPPKGASGIIIRTFYNLACSY